MEKREFKMIATYDSTGDTIENIFYSLIKQKLLSCDKSGLDSPKAKEVQWETQDK